MLAFQVHRLKEALRQQFRGGPHTIGAATVKPKDYEAAEVVQADTPYSAWEQLRSSPRPLLVGDLLEIPGGMLRIYKYVGLEEAHWSVPEPAPQADPVQPTTI